MRLIYWSADLITIYKPVKACFNSAAELEMTTESASYSLLGNKFKKKLKCWNCAQDNDGRVDCDVCVIILHYMGGKDAEL